MNNILTFKEISEQSFDTLVKYGYCPSYTDDEHIEFDCNIGGVKFSFYPIEDEVFGYSAEFNLKKELSTDERERLENLYMQTDTDDVIFENFHIDGAFVCLSSAFTCDFYPEDFVELSIKMITSAEGIVPELKAKSYVWEEN